MAEKFKEAFTIPYFLMSLRGEFDASEGRSSFERGELKAVFSGMHPAPVCKESENCITMLVGGAPVLGNDIATEHILEKIAGKEQIDKDFIRSLNGEFLIVHFNKKSSKLAIVNDRFTSVPLYYWSDSNSKSFYATPYFSDLWEFLKKSGNLKINNDAFFEFLWLQRLLGTKTYDKKDRKSVV